MGSRSLVWALGFVVVACAGKPAQQASTPAPESKEDAGAPVVDAGPPPRPFAGSAAEATQLIQQALEKKMDGMNECVKQFRYRKHLAHERIEVAVGIDQEGHVLGVTLPKRKPDEELSKCIQVAVKDAPFPKSHSGVITVTQSFEEMVR
jgi:hypothetical protein